MTGRIVRAPDDVLVHLRDARDLADRDVALPLDLDRLACAAGLSKYDVLRLFRATGGMTPAEDVSRWATQEKHPGSTPPQRGSMITDISVSVLVRDLDEDERCCVDVLDFDEKDDITVAAATAGAPSCTPAGGAVDSPEPQGRPVSEG